MWVMYHEESNHELDCWPQLGKADGWLLRFVLHPVIKASNMTLEVFRVD
jgi:hypothetical protein